MRSLKAVILVLLLCTAPLAWAAAPAASAASGPAASAAKAYQPLIKPYADDINAAFSVASTLLIALVAVAAGWLLVREWRRDPLVIEPFDVPKELQDQGLTGAVLSQQLADKVFELQRNARPDDGPADIAFVEPPRMLVDLQLPGISWSIRGAIRYFKRAFDKTEKRIAGEVLRNGSSYTLHLRSAEGRSAEVTTRFQSAADVAQALVAAAEMAITLTDTLEAATILYSRETSRTGYDKTLDAIRLHLATAPMATHQDAYVLWASVCRALGDSAGMESRLALARSADVSRWTGNATGKLRPRYLNFTGSLYRERGQLDLAEAAFLAVLRLDSRNIGALTNMGLLALDRERSFDARCWFKMLVSERPKSGRGYRGLGLAATRSGDWQAAIRFYSRAIDVAPLARWPRTNRIDAYRVVGDFAAAEADIDALLDLDDAFAPLHRFRSHVARDKDDLLNAERWARKAVALDPGDAWNFVELAQVSHRLGRYAESIAAAQTALAQREGMAEALKHWGIALAQQGHTAAAIAKLRQGAAQPGRDSVWCLLELSDLYRRQGRYAEAIAAARDAAKQRPRGTEGLRRWAWALRDQNDLSGAEDKLRQAVKAMPLEMWVQLDLSTVLLRQYRYEEAERAAQEALVPGVRPAHAYRQSASVLLAQNKVASARAVLERAAREQPSELWALLDLCELLRRQEAYPKALDAVEEALRRRPRSSYALRRWAGVLRDLGDSEGARIKFAEAVAAAPYDVDALIESADFHRAIDQLTSAESLARQAVTLRPDLSGPKLCLARVLRDQGDPAGAQAARLAAIDSEPGRVWPRVEHVGALRSDRRHAEAIQAARDLLAACPGEFEGFRQWARVLQDLGDMAGAEKKLREAVAAAPRKVETWLALADLLFDADKFGDAIAAAQRALALDPCRLPALRLIGAAKAQQGDTDGAIAQWRKAAEMAPDEVEDLLRIAQIQRDKNDLALAHTTLASALERRPDSLRVLRDTMALHLSQKDWDAAEVVLARLRALAPMAVDDLLAYASALGDAGETKQAIETLRRAKARQPRSAAVRWRLALLLKQNQPALAEDELKQAIEIAPWVERYQLERAEWRWKAGDHDAAIKVLVAAETLRPGSARILGQHALLLLKKGDRAAADIKLQQAMATSSPTDTDALVSLADRLDKFGRGAEAMQYARQAASLKPARVFVMDDAAQILKKNGDLAGAIELLTAATELENKYYWLWWHFAEALFDAGRSDEAAKACAKVLALEPGHSGAARMLEKIEAQNPSPATPHLSPSP